MIWLERASQIFSGKTTNATFTHINIRHTTSFMHLSQNCIEQRTLPTANTSQNCKEGSLFHIKVNAVQRKSHPGCAFWVLVTCQQLLILFAIFFVFLYSLFIFIGSFLLVFGLGSTGDWGQALELYWECSLLAFVFGITRFPREWAVSQFDWIS